MAKAKTTIKKITQNAWECTKIFKTGEIEKRIVKDPIDIWSIGNTGVRNPWRIPGGYKVYVESNQVGKIRTAQEQKLFKEKLLLAGEIGGDPKKDADASITRKYRLMFNKYGFAYPEVLKKFCVEKMIDGVFVIPSSIHEVLLMIADKNKADIGYMRRTIKEVNNENVSEVERLSDSLYYYDVATDTLRIAE